MNVHKNARLTPRGRERIVLQVETPGAVAQAVGVCPRTVRKWLIGTVAKAWRDCTIGHPGRIDCGSRRLKRWSRRRQRWTGKQIAAETGVSPATVSRVLRRLGLNKLSLVPCPLALVAR
jgi:transposase